MVNPIATPDETKVKVSIIGARRRAQTCHEPLFTLCFMSASAWRLPWRSPSLYSTTSSCELITGVCKLSHSQVHCICPSWNGVSWHAQVVRYIWANIMSCRPAKVLLGTAPSTCIVNDQQHTLPHPRHWTNTGTDHSLNRALLRQMDLVRLCRR